MTMTTLTEFSGQLGVVLPPEAIANLQLAAGDQLQVVETVRGIELQRVDPELALQMEIGERVLKENEPALRRLAE